MIGHPLLPWELHSISCNCLLNIHSNSRSSTFVAQSVARFRRGKTSANILSIAEGRIFLSPSLSRLVRKSKPVIGSISAKGSLDRTESHVSDYDTDFRYRLATVSRLSHRSLVLTCSGSNSRNDSINCHSISRRFTFIAQSLARFRRGKTSARVRSIAEGRGCNASSGSLDGRRCHPAATKRSKSRTIRTRRRIPIGRCMSSCITDREL